MTSTTKNRFRKILIGLIWILIWQILAMIIKEEILLPSPLLVFRKFVQLLISKDFYLSIFHSSIKILFGFILSIIIAILFAYTSYKSQIFYEFISPIINIFRSIPLASLVILLLFWINSDYLSIYVGFIMAMPIVYTNVYTGLKNIDKNIIEMASIYQVSEAKKLKYIYKIKIKPYLSSSIITVSGLVFKAGVAGEVIGLPSNSIGKNLYNSKVYLDMPSLLAWSIAILIITSILEKILRRILGAYDD